MADEKKPEEPTFTPLTDAILVEDVDRVRLKVDRDVSGDLKIAVEYNDEGIEWGKSTEWER